MGAFVLAGIDVLLHERFDLVQGRRVGLVTSASGVTRDLTSTTDALWRHPDVSLVALFGPEHGVMASAADAAAVPSLTDPRTGLPVYSLYGATWKPTAEMLRSLDLLLFDIQDVGARFYTYIWTLSYVMEATGEAGIPLIVLDRPNPIGGVVREGPVLDPDYASFVGRWPIPVRHGLTTGELASLWNDEGNLGVELTVVPCIGWYRNMWWDETGLVWVPPSPAMPSLLTATLYPGTCLLEGTNLSEGRGTALPFQLAGAVWVDAHRLANALNSLGLPGVRFRPVHFTPTSSKWAGQLCQGVQIHVTDRDALRPLSVGLHLLRTVRDLWPESFAWRPNTTPGRPPFFDLLIGNGWVRPALDQGVPVEEIVSRWRADLEEFEMRCKPHLLYV